MTVALTILAVLLILLASESWYRLRKPHDEVSRKFVHITVGSFVAFWPFFLSWNQIVLLSLAFLIAVSISKYLNLFQAIHTVQRPTWGEVFFALAVGLIALISQDKWIYTSSLLIMSLADGLAAIIGTHFGGKHKYTIFGHGKSLIGTFTFFITSCLILYFINPELGTPLSLLGIAGISLLATISENIFVAGLDNLIVPLLIAVLLSNV